MAGISLVVLDRTGGESNRRGYLLAVFGARPKFTKAIAKLQQQLGDEMLMFKSLQWLTLATTHPAHPLYATRLELYTQQELIPIISISGQLKSTILLRILVDGKTEIR
jgi:hypothetical protein